MVLAYMQIKKIPRILLFQGEEFMQKLSGLYVIWPDRIQTDVFDLSLSGMSVSSLGMRSKVRLDQSISLELRISGVEDTLLLKARVVQIHEQSIGFVFESISSEGRMTLEQQTKDRMVVENLKPISPNQVISSMGGDIWLHGPFDTNVILWNKMDQVGLQKVWVEYDNLIWIYENGEVQLKRSSSAVDEIQGYFNTSNGQALQTAKVSMGASWPDRLLKVLEQVHEREGALAELIQIFRRQRGVR